VLGEDNARLDNDRLRNPGNYMNKIVYDCVDQSPFYTDEPYFDENELIELPSEEANYDYRKYPFGPTVQNNAFSQNFNQKGQKINKYYTKLKPYYKAESAMDSTLIFESRFESGNLRRAVQVAENEYDLILKYDYGTTVYTQWFYFKISNVRRGVHYKFNIINLIKSDSSYN